LFDEAMLLYCGAGHPLFPHRQTHRLAQALLDSLRSHAFAGLGYHSPNMEISQQRRMPRKATGFDQESIATLILSGRFLGFLPIHYAQSFVACRADASHPTGLVSLRMRLFLHHPPLTAAFARHPGVSGLFGGGARPGAPRAAAAATAAA